MSILRATAPLPTHWELPGSTVFPTSPCPAAQVSAGDRAVAVGSVQLTVPFLRLQAEECPCKHGTFIEYIREERRDEELKCELPHPAHSHFLQPRDQRCRRCQRFNQMRTWKVRLLVYCCLTFSKTLYQSLTFFQNIIFQKNK